MPSTHKKVIVRKMDRDSVSGYVSPTQFVQEGKLELLSTSGTVILMDLREVKGVYFVREFGDSESLTRKTFTSRPVGGAVGAAAVQRQRSAGRTDAR
jgi:hypothetical protein